MLELTIWRVFTAWSRFLTLSLLIRLSGALKLQESHGDGPDPILTGCADFLWVKGYGLYERYTGSGKVHFHYVSVDNRDSSLRHLKWQPNQRYENPTLPGSYGKWELGNFDDGEYDTSKVFAKLENSVKCPQGSFKLTVESPRGNDPDWVKVWPYTRREKIYLDNALRRLTMGNLFTNEFTDAVERIGNGMIQVLCYEHDAYHKKFNRYQVAQGMKDSFLGFMKIAMLFGIPGVELNDKFAGRDEEGISKLLGVLDHTVNVGLGSYYMHQAYMPDDITHNTRVAEPDTIAADAAHFVITKNTTNASSTIEAEPAIAQLAATSKDPTAWVSLALPRGLAAVELAMKKANLSILAEDVHQAVDFAKAATNATVMRWLPGGEAGTGVEKATCSKLNSVWLTVWNALQIPLLDFIGVFRARSIFSDDKTLWEQWFEDNSWWDAWLSKGRTSWERGLDNVRRYTGKYSRIRSPQDNPGDDKVDDAEGPVLEPIPEGEDEDGQGPDGRNVDEQELLDTPV